MQTLKSAIKKKKILRNTVTNKDHLVGININEMQTKNLNKHWITINLVYTQSPKTTELFCSE